MDSKQQRIGVIGTGAIGGFYGLMLAHAGHDVHFSCAASSRRSIAPDSA